MADLDLLPPLPPMLRRQLTTIHCLGDDLLREILVRLPSLPSLVRAAIACPAFLHAVRSSPAFRRRFQALHPPHLLGVFHDNCRVGIPPFSPLRGRYDPDHTAVIRGADFFFMALTEHDDYYPYGWEILSCHRGYVLVINITTDQLAAFNPLTESLHVLPPPSEKTVRSRSLEYHIVFSEDDPSEFRILCVEQRKMPVCRAVYSPATSEWSPVPQQGVGGREDIPDYDIGRQVGAFVYWKHDSGRVLVLSTSTLELSAIELPEELRDKDPKLYALGQTETGRLCMVGLDESLAKSASLSVWCLVADDAGVQEWILEQDSLPLTEFANEDDDTVQIEDESTVQIEEIVDGFVYLSSHWDGEDSFLSICLETEELDLLSYESYARVGITYFMAWPPSLVCNKSPKHAVPTLPHSVHATTWKGDSSDGGLTPGSSAAVAREGHAVDDLAPPDSGERQSAPSDQAAGREVPRPRRSTRLPGWLTGFELGQGRASTLGFA